VLILLGVEDVTREQRREQATGCNYIYILRATAKFVRDASKERRS
jgi:hypothetical protein